MPQPKTWENLICEHQKTMKLLHSDLPKLHKKVIHLKRIFPNPWIAQEFKKAENKEMPHPFLFYLMASGPMFFYALEGLNNLIDLAIKNGAKQKVERSLIVEDGREFHSIIVELYCLKQIVDRNIPVRIEPEIGNGKNADLRVFISHFWVYLEIKSVQTHGDLQRENHLKQLGDFKLGKIKKKCKITVNMKYSPELDDMKTIDAIVDYVNSNELPIETELYNCDVKVEPIEDGVISITFGWNRDDPMGIIRNSYNNARIKFPEDFTNPILIAIQPFSSRYDIGDSKLADDIKKLMLVDPKISGVLLLEPHEAYHFKELSGKLASVIIRNPAAINPLPEDKLFDEFQSSEQVLDTLRKMSVVQMKQNIILNKDGHVIRVENPLK